MIAFKSKYFDKSSAVKRAADLLEQGADVIDVGAHEGETVLWLNKNFNLNKIVCYEASSINFKKLQEKINKKKILKSITDLNNFGIGKENSELKFYNTSEPSSSTFCNINFESDYFRRKKKILDFFFKEKYVNITEEILIRPLKNEIERYGFKEVDILKIDTEGFEYNVLLGLDEKLSIIKYIYFEHHFDHMIVKNYTLSDIDNHFGKGTVMRMGDRENLDIPSISTGLFAIAPHKLFY